MHKFRSLGIGLSALFLLASPASHAVTPHTSEFTRNWVATPLVQVDGQDGQVQARVLQRYIRTGQTDFLVGSVSFFKVPKAGTPEAPDTASLAEKLRNTLDLKNWRVSSFKNAAVYQGLWPKANRYVRLYVQEDRTSITCSVAVFRIAYWDALGLESELLQRKLAGLLDVKVPWLDRFVAALEAGSGISEADAATTCSACSTLTDSAQALSCQSQCTSSDAIKSLGDTPSDDSPTTSGGRKPLVSNDALKKMVVSVGRAVTALSVITGTLLGGSIASGLERLSAYTSERMTHAKDQKARQDVFEQALGDYEKLAPKIKDLEAELDSSIALRRLTQKLGGRETALQWYETVAKKEAEMKFRQDRVAKALAHGESADSSCLAADFAAIGETKSVLAELQKLIDAISKPDADQALCSLIKDDLAMLIKAEGTMQEVRSDLLDGIDVWEKNWDKKLVQNIKRSDSTHDRQLAANEADLKGAAQSHEILMAQLNSDVTAAIRDCVTQKAAGRTATDADTADCAREVDSAATPKGRELAMRRADIEKGYQDRKAGAEARQQQLTKGGETAHPSYQLDMAAHALYQKWLDELDSEQHSGAIAALMQKLDARGETVQELCSN